MLQQIGNLGNTLSAVAMPNSELDPDGTLQRTNAQGVASYPLSLTKAKTGEYVLKFQVEEASATVLFTTPAFQVVNPIGDIKAAEGDDWNEVQIKDFQKAVRIPRQLKFRVSISGNRSLQDLIDNGYQIHIQLSLKGIDPKVAKQIAELKKMADAQADEAGKVAAKKAKEMANTAGSAVKRVITNQVSSALESKNPFKRMSEELQEACLKMPMAQMAAQFNETLSRDPELADAIKSKPDIVNPAEQMSQFIRTITGGGAKMATGASMRLQLEEEIKYSDLVLVKTEIDSSTNKFIGTYEVTKKIDFKFVENGEYAWEVTINGVTSKKEAFKNYKAIYIEPSTPEKAFKWVFTFLALIVGAIVLASNTTKHHYFWLFISIPATIVLICVCPSMEGSNKALDEKWPIIAIVTCSLMLICLIWALIIELKLYQKVKKKDANNVAKIPIPFGVRRDMFFEMYSRRRLLHMIGKKNGKTVTEPAEPHPSRLKMVPFIKQMIKPFNPETAFFFPSQLWVGFWLSLLSYIYILIKAIQILNGIEDSLNSLLDKTITATVKLMMTIEDQYRLVSIGQDLPDSALQFMRKQLDLIRGWFESLVNVIVIGFTIGTVLAGILTILALFLTFFVWRSYVLRLRRGEVPWPKKGDGAIVYDSMFMGQMIATTAVGFILIVAVCVLVCLPFGFKIIWDIIWAARHYIIFAIALPAIVNSVGVIIAKKIMFAPFNVKHRAAASIFMFWQLAVSILGGIASAITRFVMGILGIVVGLPTVVFPITPEPLNKLVLLDKPHKTFLAAIMMFHTHNHPVVIFVKNTLLDFLKARQEAVRGGESQEVIKAKATKRAKRFVILLLMKHPWLTKHRKAYLLAERRREWEEKQAAKEKKVVVQEDKTKPSAEEQAVMRAILNYRVEIEQTQVRIQSLENGLSKIRKMPEGPDRKQAMEKVLAGQSAASPR